MTTPDPYHARRRKARLITGIGLFLLSPIAVAAVWLAIVAFIPEFPTLRTLAALPPTRPIPSLPQPSEPPC